MTQAEFDRSVNAERCTCCNRPLNNTRIVNLELDQRTGEYHDFGGVPADESQGWFAFGPSCAMKARKKAAIASYDRTVALGAK